MTFFNNLGGLLIWIHFYPKKASVMAMKEVVDRVVVVGLGYAYDDVELTTIASLPISSNFYKVEESRDLASFVPTIADEICKTKVIGNFNTLVLIKQYQFDTRRFTGRLYVTFLKAKSVTLAVGKSGVNSICLEIFSKRVCLCRM